MVKSYMIYRKMSIGLNDKFSQKMMLESWNHVNNLAGLLKLKFFAQYTKRFRFYQKPYYFCGLYQKNF